jgi:hypothetical protein
MPCGLLFVAEASCLRHTLGVPFRSSTQARARMFWPFTVLSPWKLCDGLKMAILAIFPFWKSYDQNRASNTPDRNAPSFLLPITSAGDQQCDLKN